MNISEETLYAVDKNGEWWKVGPLRMERLGNRDDHISRYFNDTGFVFHNVMADYSIHAVADGDYRLFKTIDSIHLKTWFNYVSEEEQVKMVPVFSRGEQSIEMNPEWKPPEDMVLAFITHILQHHFCNAYLIAISMESRGLFKLPLPNLYGDGKLCLGGGADIPGRNAVDLADNALEDFNQSKWNRDLLSRVSRESLNNMFAFDEQGKQIPHEGDWKTSCEEVSCDIYNTVCSHVVEARAREATEGTSSELDRAIDHLAGLADTDTAEVLLDEEIEATNETVATF